MTQDKHEDMDEQTVWAPHIIPNMHCVDSPLDGQEHDFMSMFYSGQEQAQYILIGSTDKRSGDPIMCLHQGNDGYENILLTQHHPFPKSVKALDLSVRLWVAASWISFLHLTGEEAIQMGLKALVE